MSTETIFRQLGRLNESHTGIGPGKTREEYLKLFSRTSYSSKNEWPYSSPFAGFYDISNSSTRLILLNQRYKFSHLRGQILPKEISPPEEDSYKTLYENILASQQPEDNSKHTHKISVPRIPIDPYRHFESMFYIIIRSCLLLVFSFYLIQGQNKYWHNRMCKGSLSTDDIEDYLSSASEINMTLRSRRPHTAGASNARRTRSLSIHRRSQSISDTDEFRTDPKFAEALWEKYAAQLAKSQRPKLGLQQSRMREPSNRLLRQSGIYRNPALTRGQKLYLLEKCRIYDVEDSKTRHTNSYLQVLTNRFYSDLPAYKLDSFYKPEFRLNNPQDYFSYAKFVKTPRPTARQLNTGYFTSKQVRQNRIPGYQRKQPLNDRSNGGFDKKDFVVNSNTAYDQQKLGSTNTTHLPRRISASSIPTKIEKTVSLRLRQEPREITKIPVLPSQSHD